MLRVGSHLTSRDAYITLAATMPWTDKPSVTPTVPRWYLIMPAMDYSPTRRINSGNNPAINNGAEREQHRCRTVCRPV